MKTNKTVSIVLIIIAVLAVGIVYLIYTGRITSDFDRGLNKGGPNSIPQLPVTD